MTDDLVEFLKDVAAGAKARDWEPAKIVDPIDDIEPTLKGAAARAWTVDQDEYRKNFSTQDDGSIREDGSLATWIVEAPKAHPLWHSYAVCLIHLRPVMGLEPAIIYKPDVTHEIFLIAIDPDFSDRANVIRGLSNPKFLNPVNYAGQFIEITDELAIDRVAKAVQEICDGTLNPDTDFRSQWITLFGNTNLNTNLKR